MGGDAKSADIEKAIRQTLKFLNPTNRLHENTSNFYVTNPQNTTVDARFTRDQRTYLHNTNRCKE